MYATIEAYFSNSDGEEKSAEFEIEVGTGCALDEFHDQCADFIESGEWELDNYDLVDCEGFEDDGDVCHQFKGVGFDLADFNEFAELCDNLGPAFELRYIDLGGIDENQFRDSYNGAHDSVEKFAERLINDCYDIPDYLYHYIDWEKFGADLMMDYSEYVDHVGQVHIFHD
ncbi:MAG: hypothetical protein DRH04_03530 [Deltaproteobacteria bacterium]|nr:MAG: hypothetical protein DRH04_03530 [Deltaproteobacteria bacterium]